MMEAPQTMPAEDTTPKEPSFEEAMDALESIVSSLETERLPLEEMVTAYERGVKLLRACRDRIESARQRVEIITVDLEGRGRATLGEFQPSDSTESGAEPSRKARRKPASSESGGTEAGDGGDIRLF